MACERNSKSNETRILTQHCQGIWIFFVDLELEQTLLFYNIAFMKYHKFHVLSELYRCKEKISHFFLTF